MTTPAYRDWVQAQFKAGKPLLCKFKDGETWHSVLDTNFDWDHFDYRIDTPAVSFKAIVNSKNEVVNLSYWETDNTRSDHQNMSDEEILESADATLKDGPHRLAMLVEIIPKEHEDLEDSLTKLMGSFLIRN